MTKAMKNIIMIGMIMLLVLCIPLCGCGKLEDRNDNRIAIVHDINAKLAPLRADTKIARYTADPVREGGMRWNGMREIVLHEDYANAEEYLNDNNRVRIIIYIGPDYVDEVTPEYKAEVTENVYTMIPAKNVYEILFKEDKVWN